MPGRRGGAGAGDNRGGLTLVRIGAAYGQPTAGSSRRVLPCGSTSPRRRPRRRLPHRLPERSEQRPSSTLMLLPRCGRERQALDCGAPGERRAHRCSYRGPRQPSCPLLRPSGCDRPRRRPRDDSLDDTRASAGALGVRLTPGSVGKDVMSRVVGVRRVRPWREGGRAFVSNGMGRRARVAAARPAVQRKAPTVDQRIRRSGWMLLVSRAGGGLERVDRDGR